MIRILPLLLAACGPSTDALLDGQQPPPPYGATLWSSPWVPGSDVTVTVDGADPNDAITLVAGSPGTLCPPALGGLCSDLGGSPTVLGRFTTDAQGYGSTTFRLPPSIPAGFARRLQAFGGIGGAPYATNPWDGEAAACPGAPGCNWLTNAGFDADIDGWSTLPTVLEISHEPSIDRGNDPASGSMGARDIGVGSHTSAYQCVPVTPGEVFTFGGYIYLPASSAGAYGFSQFIFYVNDNCRGSLAGFDSTPWDDTTDTWIQHELTFTVPTGAASVRVGLGTVESTSADPISYVDDAYLYRQ